MYSWIDVMGNTVELARAVLHGHIYRRHPELHKKLDAIKETITNPDCIARSKKDGRSLLYFRKINGPLWLMVVGTPQEKQIIIIKTSFYVLNTSKGDPIIWQKKIST